jgi:ATP-dependent DNA helicase RecG
MPSAISLNTPIEDLHSFKIARLGQILARKLAAALASQTNKKHFSEATVEDLLSYLPMRYEDRSHLATIKDLEAGMEATLELQVKHAGGYQVRNKKRFQNHACLSLKSQASISTTQRVVR